MAPCNRKKNYNHTRRILLIMSCLGVPLSFVRAESPDESVFANAVEVNDSELAEMRGKFVSPGQITYFGVEMQTQWQTGSGEVLSAGMKMDMNFPKDGNAPPTITLVPTVSIVANSNKNSNGPNLFPIQPGPPDTTITSKGINNISGVAQTIQAGGDQNKINNAIGMDVAITSGLPNGQTPSQTHELTPSSVQKSTDSGSLALAGVSQKGIQVYAYVPNQGEILQRISGSPGGDGNIMQSARLVGDQHTVINTMTISTSFNAMSTNTTFNNSIQFDLKGF